MKPETIVLHEGHRRDESTTSVAVPIYQTTSYQFDNTEPSKLFCLPSQIFYTRIMNPTVAVLESRISKIDGGVAALAVSSGQSASAFAAKYLPCWRQFLVQLICTVEHGIYFRIHLKTWVLSAGL